MNHRLCVRPLTGALLLALGQAAGAAPGPDLSATDLDRVEVHGQRPAGYTSERTSTATKTDTLLRDTPQSITVINEQGLRDQAMHNVADVVRYLPGVGIAQGEGNRDNPVFRGSATTADLFVDGMRDDVQYVRDFYNVERVEALKGPNAMIFGRGGSGGVLNRVTKAADWETRRDVSVQLGDDQRRRITADVDQPIGADSAFRVTGLYEDSGSFRDDVDVRRYGINPTLALRTGENTRVTFGYERFHDERTADRGISSYRGLPVDVPVSTFFGNPDLSNVEATVDAFTALVEHDFANGATLRNRTRYAQYDKFYQNVFPGAVNAAGTQVAIQAYNNATQRDNLFNQTDVVLKTDMGGIAQTVLFGGEFGRQVTDNFRNTGYFGPPGSTATSVSVPLSNPRYTGPLQFRQSATDADNHGTADVAALYAQDQLEFSPHWQGIVGVRYDRFQADVRNNRTGDRFESTDNLLSPRVGVVYKPVEPVSLYANYSLAYLPRAGDQLSSLSTSNEALEPEKFVNYELGAKWDVTQKFALTGAVYRLDRSNVATADPADNTRLVLLSGAAQRVEGAEIGISGNITDAWSLMGGYAYQNATLLQPITSVPTNATARPTTIPAGTTLPQVPRQSASLWNRYDFNPRWGVGLGAIYRDEMFTSTSNAVRVKSFIRYDAAVFFRASDALQLQLNVENLLDKHYMASANSDTNISPGAPRSLYLTANFSF